MSQKIKVLVVDDHVDTANSLCEWLQRYDYEAHAAYNGEDALKQCAEGSYNLALLDIQMPDIDGHEVCRRLKQTPGCEDMAIVFVTARGEGSDVLRSYELGAIDYITKPFNPPMVMMRIQSALTNHVFAQQIRAAVLHVDENTYIDPLTGLRNRKFLLERLQEEVDKAHRYYYPVSCIVFDIDDIQAVDEESGPVSIDDLLAELAISFRSYTRAYDILARYDGTLFAAVLPHTPLDQALKYVEKIRNDVEATTFSDPNFPTKAGMSVGAVTCRNGTARSAEYVIGEAMRSLLRAKSEPGNRVVGRTLEDAPAH
jgi:diguanylate cyclase (GGDEF)-like protein